MGCSVCSNRSSKFKQITPSPGCENIRYRLIKVKKAMYAKYRLTKNKAFYEDYLSVSGMIRRRDCPEEYVVEAYEIEYYK